MLLCLIDQPDNRGPRLPPNAADDRLPRDVQFVPDIEHDRNGERSPSPDLRESYDRLNTNPPKERAPMSFSRLVHHGLCLALSFGVIVSTISLGTLTAQTPVQIEQRIQHIQDAILPAVL